METTLDIKQWGNSLGIRLPSAIAKEIGLVLNQKVRITVKDKALMISAVDAPLTLEQRLALFNPEKHGGEL
jgi:antitoxin MazE